MALLVKGVTKISELEIDVDKNWAGKGISNIKAIAEAMDIGDLAEHDGTKLARRFPGAIHYVLTSQGPGHSLIWAPGGSYFLRYIPCVIGLIQATAVIPVDRAHDKDAPITTWNRQNYGDAPADYIKRLTPSVGLVDAEAVVTVDKTYNKDGAIATGHTQTLSEAVGGAVAEEIGVGQTDETAEANSPAANDMTLLPDPPQVSDAYYIGAAHTFSYVIINMGRAGYGVWTITWEYWDGDSWEPLTNVVDATDGFKDTVLGHHHVSFTIPGDWAQTVIQAMNLFWIRGRVSAFTSEAQTPLGTRAWVSKV